VISAGFYVREGEVSCLRRLCLPIGSAIIERQCHLGARDGGAAAVDDGPGDGSLLTERRRRHGEAGKD
jgi:hypothetical protein